MQIFTLKNTFFKVNIWSYQKKAVPLREFLFITTNIHNKL